MTAESCGVEMTTPSNVPSSTVVGPVDVFQSKCQRLDLPQAGVGIANPSVETMENEVEGQGRSEREEGTMERRGLIRGCRVVTCLFQHLFAQSPSRGAWVVEDSQQKQLSPSMVEQLQSS